MSTTVNPIPEHMHTLTPHLICKGANEAVEFYKKAFNAVEIMRLPAPDGTLMHGMLRIGDSALMLMEEMANCGALGPTATGVPVVLHLQVADVDALVAQAVDAGAKLVMPVKDEFWGDRYGQVQDPFGHRWAIATHVRDVSHEEIRLAMQKMSSTK